MRMPLVSANCSGGISIIGDVPLWCFGTGLDFRANASRYREAKPVPAFPNHAPSLPHS
jgi:hypothetical protein